MLELHASSVKQAATLEGCCFPIAILATYKQQIVELLFLVDPVAKSLGTTAVSHIILYSQKYKSPLTC